MSNIIDSIQLSGVTYQIQGSGGGVPESVFTAYTASTDSRIGEDEEVTAAALNALDEKIDSISGGGNPTVEVTQAEYDAMVSAGTVSADTYYIITDAQAGDLTNYYTKTETDNAITAATSTKQDTLVSGTNIKTINNESILGSGNIDIQGGGGTVDQTIISGSTNAVAGGAVYDKIDEVEQVTAAGLNAVYDKIDEVEQVTAAGLNAVNDKFDGLKLKKLTQSQYDALSGNTDSNTLYVIVN